MGNLDQYPYSQGAMYVCRFGLYGTLGITDLFMLRPAELMLPKALKLVCT